MPRVRISLFESEPTLAQQLIVSFWAINLGFVGVLWLTTSVFSGGAPELLDAFGMLFGLLATFFALTQFMLMGRIAWIEQEFGLDRLASFHRLNGYLTITFILLHPIFITVSFALENHINLWQQYVDLIMNFSYVWLALVAQILFIAVAASSIYIARKRLKFESWYFVHLTVYAAIVFASLHQLAIGMSFSMAIRCRARTGWVCMRLWRSICWFGGSACRCGTSCDSVSSSIKSWPKLPPQLPSTSAVATFVDGRSCRDNSCLSGFLPKVFGGRSTRFRSP